MKTIFSRCLCLATLILLGCVAIETTAGVEEKDLHPELKIAAKNSIVGKNQIIQPGDHLTDPYPEVGALYDDYDRLGCSMVFYKDHVALTAAHCITGINHKVSFDGGKTFVKVVRFHRHPNWINSGTRADIAVLFLDPEAKMRFPHPIALNEISETYHTFWSPITTVGWLAGFKFYSRPDTTHLYGRLVGSDQVRWIAGRKRPNAFFGESGGAVYWGSPEENEKDHNRVLVGIISRFYYVGDEMIDSSATSVLMYTDWINQTIKEYKEGKLAEETKPPVFYFEDFEIEIQFD
jgi:hypothetical protein